MRGGAGSDDGFGGAGAADLPDRSGCPGWTVVVPEGSESTTGHRGRTCGSGATDSPDPWRAPRAGGAGRRRCGAGGEAGTGRRRRLKRFRVPGGDPRLPRTSVRIAAGLSRGIRYGCSRESRLLWCDARVLGGRSAPATLFNAAGVPPCHRRRQRANQDVAPEQRRPRTAGVQGGCPTVPDIRPPARPGLKASVLPASPAGRRGRRSAPRFAVFPHPPTADRREVRAARRRVGPFSAVWSSGRAEGPGGRRRCPDRQSNPRAPRVSTPVTPGSRRACVPDPSPTITRGPRPLDGRRRSQFPCQGAVRVMSLSPRLSVP